ncbi:cytochrome P450 [Mucidula mucida]|nr:cytochrome P450 [Mucidula mucida]KAF8903415.1 cytochrome P450 [Mucidula mucida]
MPTEGKDWLIYADWGHKYGGICSVSLMGQPLIIVNSADVMQEMERQGTVYSDRPRLEMGGELVGYSKTIVIMPYGAKFRTFRKHFSRVMGTTATLKQFLPMVEAEMKKFLTRSLTKPASLSDQLRKTSGSIIMKLAYGITVQEGEDPFVTLIEHANDNFNIATTPGKFMVDVIPLLRFVPAWIPGAGFKTLAKQWKKAFDDMVQVPYAFTRKMMVDGSAPVSYVSSSMEHEETLTAADIDDIKHVAASMYGAGADTTVSAQYAFFLAMLLNPDVQKKAQAEIDDVVGGDRLPTFNDREHLPYVNAVVTELLRWHNVAPLGVPHRALEDGVISGYFVPKGSIIITNLWQMLHDPEVYPDPMHFDPTRHLGKEVQRDPRHACFGFGRRVCPGLHLAEASVYILVAMSLAVFDVSPVIEDGVPVLPTHENTDGTISHQKPFKCNLQPRSERAVALIRSECADL